MRVPTLLTVDPDKLFEEHTITEILDVHKQLQKEVEFKREDLRSLVGERYRDLLKAADTIVEMKDTAEHIMGLVNNISTSCRTLQEKQLIGFKQHVPSTLNRSSKQFEEISATVDMRILLSLPKEIWSAIDNKDYLVGAQLYLLAAHIHLKLKVSQNSKNIFETYPVITKQWEIISSCRKVLIDGAKQELKIIEIDDEKAVDNLVSLLLLEVKSPDHLVSDFLNLRTQTFLNILQSDQLPTVKDKVCAIVQLLQKTLHLVYLAFYGEGRLYSVVESITSKNAEPTLKKLNQTNLYPSQYLSPLISEFHPKTSKPIVPITSDVLQNKTNSWMGDGVSILEQHLVSLLKLVTNVRHLYKIRQDIFDLKTISNWENMMTALCGRNINLWQFYLRKFVTRRVLELIELSWREIMEKVQDCLRKINEKLSKEKNEPENDIRWLVWSESDLTKSNINELLLKTQCYTPNVVQLCNCLDTQLEVLLHDIGLYVNESAGATDCQDDAVEIVRFMNHCSFSVVKQLTGSIRSKRFSKEQIESESSLLLKARFLHAMSQLCPNLEKCMKQTYNQMGESDSSSQNSWPALCTLLTEESLSVWNTWLQLIRQKYQLIIKKNLSEDCSLKTLLTTKAPNQVVMIEEETDEGQNLKSELRIASQPSFALQALLFTVSQQLNAVGPHALPSRVHQEVIRNLVSDIFSHYELMQETSYQSHSFQLLLDVKVLTLMFVSANDKELTEKSHRLCERLERTIDPFDLDVQNPYLHNNIKRSAQRLQTILGILINYSEKLAVFNGLKLTTTSKPEKHEEPNILSVSTNIPWFSLLPVSTGVGGSKSPQIKDDTLNDKSNKGSAVREQVKREPSPATAMGSFIGYLESYLS